MAHVPVLLNEVLGFLNPQKGETVLDATINEGGHGLKILERITPGGRLVGLDQDKAALDRLEEKLKTANVKSDVILINGNFRNLEELLKNKNIKSLDAALFDLGMSSDQLVPPAGGTGRGFSFLKDEPLIMNFKWPLLAGDLTAAEILNNYFEEDIFKILKDYGEEKYAKSIARGIVQKRKEQPFKTTGDLVDVVYKCVPGRYRAGKIHFATRTFQALRIAVNGELSALEDGLSGGWRMLSSRGRLVFISFHSLEDRIVKNFFREKVKSGEGEILTKKPVTATVREIESNSKSRSAKLRAIIKK